MRQRHRPGRPTTWSYDPAATVVVADPVAKAQTLRDLLPDVITQAEDAGLSMIAQHLARALHLATRIAAAGEDATRAVVSR